MMPMGIPAWNTQGVLPPVDVADPTSPLRSPYVVPLSEAVQRFGTSAERLTILEGLLEYRAALHAAGLTQTRFYLLLAERRVVLAERIG